MKSWICFLCVAAVGVACAPAPPRPNIVLVTLDTTRNDFLGFYGEPNGANGASPNLDRLAEDSWVYTDALSTSGWTLPAHASLFTGKFTSSHNVRLDPEAPVSLTQAIAGPFDDYRVWRLGPDDQTLAGLLRDAGYATGAFVAGPWLKKVMGLDRGFDHYDDEGIDAMNGRLAQEVTDRAIDWIRTPRDRPFFVFLNYYDAHDPYQPPPEFVRENPPKDPNADRDELAATLLRWLYEGEIRSMDHHFGRLMDFLREASLYDDTWLIVTADHGELIGEHGRFGHTSLHQLVVRIPLLLKYPSMKYPSDSHSPQRRRERAQLVDLLPTILTELELPVPDSVQGDPIGDLRHPVIAEFYPLDISKDSEGPIRVLVEGRYKFVNWVDGKDELFDLESDPDEQRDLSETQPDRIASMRTRLEAYLESLPVSRRDSTPRRVGPETREALQGLGYIE